MIIIIPIGLIVRLCILGCKACEDCCEARKQAREQAREEEERRTLVQTSQPAQVASYYSSAVIADC